jgi:hypothetical protein
MLHSTPFKTCVAMAAVVTMFAFTSPARSADADPCTRFTWDVTRELAVMRQAPEATAAGVKAGTAVPRLVPDKLYELKLSDQSAVSFAVKPAKPTLPDGAQGGVAQFRVSKAGKYRISITSGHWIDVVDGTQVIRSLDFQGARGCERPRKIVEYDLPAGRDLVLQLSGAPDATVIISITASPG